MLHERDLKRTPVRVADDDGRAIVVIPDAWLDLRVRGSYQVCLALELDRGTEEQKVWRRKVRGLLAYANGPYQEAFQTRSLTVAVVATSGEKRLLQLIRWTERELTDTRKESLSDLFVFTSLRLESVDVSNLFFAKRWYQPFVERPIALLETADAP